MHRLSSEVLNGGNASQYHTYPLVKRCWINDMIHSRSAWSFCSQIPCKMQHPHITWTLEYVSVRLIFAIQWRSYYSCLSITKNKSPYIEKGVASQEGSAANDCSCLSATENKSPCIAGQESEFAFNTSPNTNDDRCILASKTRADVVWSKTLVNPSARIRWIHAYQE